jgi:hypothetical protein
MSTNSKTNIYLVQSIEGGPIKIGRSHNVRGRVQTLKSEYQANLRILHVFKDVDARFETWLHDLFAKERLRGEWFDERILSAFDPYDILASFNATVGQTPPAQKPSNKYVTIRIYRPDRDRLAAKMTYDDTIADRIHQMLNAEGE